MFLTDQGEKMNTQKQKISVGKNEIIYGIAFICLLACAIWAKEEFLQPAPILRITVYTAVLLFTAGVFFIKGFACDAVQQKYLVALLLFSPFVIFSVYYSENAEILGGLFFFLGVETLLDGKKKWWMLWFSLAMGVGEIYFLLFMAVLLTLEKRVLYIIGKAIVPLLCGGIIYLGISCFLQGWINTGNVIWGEMIKKGFPAVAGQNASYLVLGIIIIMAVCYFSEFSKEKMYYYLMVFATLFFILGTFEDYYSVVMVPMLLLVFAHRQVYFRINMILYLVVNFCGTMCLIWKQTQVLGGIPYIEYYMGAVNACLVAAVLLIWLVNYPGQKTFKNLAGVRCETWIMVLNIIIVYPLILSMRILS